MIKEPKTKEEKYKWLVSCVAAIKRKSPFAHTLALEVQRLHHEGIGPAKDEDVLVSMNAQEEAAATK